MKFISIILIIWLSSCYSTKEVYCAEETATLFKIDTIWRDGKDLFIIYWLVPKDDIYYEVVVSLKDYYIGQTKSVLVRR